MKVLVIYYQQYQGGTRKTVEEHLYSFRKYSSEDCYYLNVACGIPKYVSNTEFDLIIYHYTLCAARFQLGLFDRIDKKWHRLKLLSGYKMAMPQDEYVNSDALCRFFKSFGVKTVFTCLPEREWSKVYPHDKSGVEDFVTVYPGYIDEESAHKIKSFVSSHRDIDIGYRARKNPYSLGRHACIKWQLADVFNEALSGSDLTLDVSTRPEDTFLGDDWYRFLSRCRVMLGCEGGASLHDPDGSVELSVATFLEQRAEASFDEVERNCFYGLDGNLELFAVSPRHFEACLTKTCQVLVEGDYAGVFKPGVHYIELKKDWSNLDEVVDRISDVEYCKQIAETAYQEIALSGKHSYRQFVETVFTQARPNAEPSSDVVGSSDYIRLIWREKLNSVFIAPSFVLYHLRGPFRSFFAVIGAPQGYQKLKKILLR